MPSKKVHADPRASSDDTHPTLKERREMLSLMTLDRSATADLVKEFPVEVWQGVAAELTATSLELKEFKETVDPILALVGGLCPIKSPWDAEHPDTVERTEDGKVTNNGLNELMHAIGRRQAERLDLLEENVRQLTELVSDAVAQVHVAVERLRGHEGS